MKTSTVHSTRKKGRPASLTLAGLVLAALVLTGCPQTTGGGGTAGDAGGSGGSSQQEINPPLAVTGLTATYSATAQTVTVSWSSPAGTTAHKYQVTVAGKTSESFGQSATIKDIAATEREETVTVVGIAKDGTQGAPAATTVKLTADLAVASIQPDATTLAPGASNQQATVSFTNGDKIGSGTVTLQFYKGDVAEGAAVNLTRNSWNDDYTASLTAPAAVGTYTLKVLLNGTPVEGKTATITVEEPQITEIKLNRTEVRPGGTIMGTITGNAVLATASLSGIVTKADGMSVGQSIFPRNLEFSYEVPAGTADGTYTITISKRTNDGSATTALKTVDFTVNANAAITDISNPFVDGLSYNVSEYNGIRSWTVQGNHLVEKYPQDRDGKTYDWETWYTFSHDTANKRITLTPSKLFSTNANKALNRAEYEADLRNSPEYSQDDMKSMLQQMIATDKAEVIAAIKRVDPSITGLDSMSNDQLWSTYRDVMLKGAGYNTWDEWVAASIQQSLKEFDVKTTYSYVADSSTGFLKVTEWWEPSATLKTLYDAGTNFNFLWWDNSGSSGVTGVTSVSVSNSYVSILGNGSGQSYQITGISGNTINLKASSGGGTATMTFGAITDKEPAYAGETPQKQMTVTYNGQNYTLNHTLTNYNFSVQ